MLQSAQQEARPSNTLIGIPPRSFTHTARAFRESAKAAHMGSDNDADRGDDSDEDVTNARRMG
jgi:hypothetical protein